MSDDESPKSADPPKRSRTAPPKKHTVELVELLEWLAVQRLAIADVRDQRELVYRLGWAAAIDHVRRGLALRCKDHE